MKLIANLAMAAALCTSACSAHAVSYTVTNLGAGTYSSDATAINNAGQVVGIAKLTYSDSYHAALWSGGAYTDLGTNGQETSIAYDINDAGHIVGASQTRLDGRYTISHATLWKNGSASFLPVPDGLFGVARSINSAGVIVGQHGAFDWEARPALWDGGGMQYLGQDVRGPATAINDRNQIVGNVGGRYLETASRWDGSQWVRMDPLGSEVSAINDAGVAAGSGAGTGSAVAWSETGWSLLGDGDTRRGGAYDINNAGVAVGWMHAGGTNWRAMVWQDGKALDLTSLIVGDRADFATLQAARGINDLGQIVGTGITRNGAVHAFLLTPVPEPRHWGMLLGGLGVLAWSVRRRRST